MAFFAERAALKNIVDPLTKRMHVSKDDARRTDPLTFLIVIKNEG